MSRLLELAAVVVMATGVAGCSVTPGMPTPNDDIEDDDVGGDDDVQTSDAGRKDGGRGLVDAGPVLFDSAIHPGPSGKNSVRPPARLNEVLTAETAPPPISGGTLAVSSDGMKVVAADPDRDNVYVIDPETTTFETIALDKGSEPGRVVLDGASRAHVALRNKSAVVSVDLKTAKVLLQTTVCTHPRGLAFDRAKDQILVACANGELVSLAAATHVEVSRSFVALDLRDVLVSKSGERFVARYRSAELLKLSADGKVVSSNAPLSTREVRLVDPGALGGVTLPTAASKPIPDGGFAILAVAAPPSSMVPVTMSPALAWKTIVGANGLPLMVHQQSQNDEVMLQASGGYGGSGDGLCDSITHPAITSYDQAGAPNTGWTVNAAGSIVDVAQSPDGAWLAFAQPGAYLSGRGSVGVVRVQNALLSTPALDSAADAGVPVPRTCTTNAEYGAEIQGTSVAFDPDGKLYVFSREPAQLSVFRRDADGSELAETLALSLSKVSVRDTGHELFHTDVGTGLSCTSCHGEALDDGHVWTFQSFGPRRTQNIRGGLLGTLPLHWEGDLATFQDLVNEVMTRRMGGFDVQAQYATALASWIDKTPALKLDPTHTTAEDSAVARGKALFESTEVACSSCHTGELLTNNMTVDVGTGGSFQVPSLHGLALHAPFMHDGCAKTLADRFDPACGGSTHGNTSQLSESDKRDLVSYLETL